MEDHGQAADWNPSVGLAHLPAQLVPTAHALRERLGDAWNVDGTGLPSIATLRHQHFDYAVVLGVSNVASHEGPRLHIAVWQDFNGCDHHACATVSLDGPRFDPDRVHAAVRQALADTDRLKAHAAVHAAAKSVLAATLLRLRHENPHGLLAREHHQLDAQFAADLADAMAALRNT
jgi:hypothetical protein